LVPELRELESEIIDDPVDCENVRLSQGRVFLVSVLDGFGHDREHKRFKLATPVLQCALKQFG
jgi:hypothetical protein